MEPDNLAVPWPCSMIDLTCGICWPILGVQGLGNSCNGNLDRQIILFYLRIYINFVFIAVLCNVKVYLSCDGSYQITVIH